MARHPRDTLRILLSSATDPYQAAERRLGLTREILAVLAERPPALVLVQTRSPLVTRDADLLRTLGAHARVSLTIETNHAEVRQAVTPRAAPLGARREALAALQAAGIPTQVAIAPLLAHDPEPFAAWLAGCAEYVVIDNSVSAIRPEPTVPGRVRPCNMVEVGYTIVTINWQVGVRPRAGTRRK